MSERSAPLARSACYVIRHMRWRLSDERQGLQLRRAFQIPPDGQYEGAKKPIVKPAGPFVLEHEQKPGRITRFRLAQRVHLSTEGLKEEAHNYAVEERRR